MITWETRVEKVLWCVCVWSGRIFRVFILGACSAGRMALAGLASLLQMGGLAG